MSSCFSVIPFSKLSYRMFEDANVVFNTLNGATHLCDDYALKIMALLEHGAADREVLISKILSSSEFPDDSEVREGVLNSLSILQGFGLIVCADEPSCY